MAIYKCKMCGGSLEINNESSVATCEYCGSVQTLPKKNDEVITNLFNRANNLRIKCEFDKAAEVYEKILNEDNNEAEAHWGLVLCKYGIEYVEDPKTYKRIPTCHRTQYESILTDVDYLAALANADAVSQKVYKAQAEEISNLQKDILAIVKNEKPFDVFICYKETDENGKRTVDSALANDIYYQLTQEGLKVFYAAITLEDKLGVEYEPYIFAALNSAKVMLVVGTKPEYFDAVWVRNEWSRYLKLMKADRSKLLIPCYRDMDAYDLPEEFSHLQAQDMGKIGFVNDVVRGIKKVVKADEPKAEAAPKETVVVNQGSGNADALLRRAFMALEDGDFARADDFCEQVLNIEPENAQAYLGKLMAELRVKKETALRNLAEPFDNRANYQKVIRFGDEALVSKINSDIDFINTRNEKARIDAINAKREAENGKVYLEAYELSDTGFIDNLKKAVGLFETIRFYKDSESKIEKCKSRIYEISDNMLNSSESSDWDTAAKGFGFFGEYKDSVAKKSEALAKIRAKDEKNKALIKKALSIGIPAVVAVVAVIFVIVKFIVPPVNYSKAQKLLAAGDYEGAYSKFYSVKGYKDSADILEDFVSVYTVKNGDQYEYDEKGNIIKEKVYDDYNVYHTKEYLYDDQNNLIKVIYSESDDITARTVTEYDVKGNLLKRTVNGEAEEHYEFVYDKNGNPTERTDKIKGTKTYYTYNSKGELIRTCSTEVNYNRELVNISDYVYDANGRLITSVHQNDGDSVSYYSYEYNEDGKVTKEQKVVKLDSSDYSTFYINDKDGKVLKEVSFDYYAASDDEEQTVYNYKYNKNGVLTEKVWLDNYDDKRVATYNSHGDHLRLTIDGKVSNEYKYVYNEKGLLTEKTDDDGIKTVYKYNAKGQLTEKSWASKGEKYNYKTTYAYDTEGRLINETETCSYTDYLLGGLDVDITETDTVEYTYDKNGNLIKESAKYHGNEIPTETLYEYNEKGQLLTKTKSGNATHYYYDENGYLMGEYCFTDPDTIEYAYDENGNIVVMESCDDYDTEVYTYEYDSNGNMIKETVTYDDSKSVYIYEYDKKGNLISKYDEDGDLRLSNLYDNNGHLISEFIYDSYGDVSEHATYSDYKVFYCPEKEQGN